MWAVCQIQAHLGRTAAWFHFITAVMIKISCNVVHLRIFHEVIIFPRPPHTVLPPFYRKHKVNFQDKKWMQKLCWIKRINYPPSHRKMFYSYGYFTTPLKSLNKQIVNITSSINKQKQPRGDFKYIVSILLSGLRRNSQTTNQWDGMETANQSATRIVKKRCYIIHLLHNMWPLIITNKRYFLNDFNKFFSIYLQNIVEI